MPHLQGEAQSEVCSLNNHDTPNTSIDHWQALLLQLLPALLVLVSILLLLLVPWNNSAHGSTSGPLHTPPRQNTWTTSHTTMAGYLDHFTHRPGWTPGPLHTPPLYINQHHKGPSITSTRPLMPCTVAGVCRGMQQGTGAADAASLMLTACGRMLLV